MDSISHYRLGQEYAAKAGQFLENYDPNDPQRDITLLAASAFAQAGQLHATLALAAITALSQGFAGPPLRDYDAWFQAASVMALIPPETDDEEVSRTYTLDEAMAHPGGIDTLTGGAIRHGGFSVEGDDEQDEDGA